MTSSFRSLLGGARDRVLGDLRADPYLRYLLLLATVLAAFWFWHRIPNFATRDEMSRILDALVPYARVLEEPSLESLRSGVVWGRVPFGATTLLYGLLLLPVVAVAAVGESSIAAIAFPDPEFGFYAAWAETPAWVWEWSIGIVRLANVVFAVGSVYLTYRLGTAIADRWTGRLGALLLTVTFGFLTIAHEGGEDMPATFFVLLTLVLLVEYLETGADWPLLGASAAGGLAIGFKLTAAPIVLVIGIGALLRAVRTPGSLREQFQPRLVVTGALLGLVVILFSFPTALVGRLDLVVGRILGGSIGRATHPTGPDALILWWFLRGYASGLGLPLLLGAVGGTVGSLAHLRRRPDGTGGILLVLSTLVGYVLLFSTWHDFRVHHLLPTFPLFALLIAWAMARSRDRVPGLVRGLAVLLMVTSGLYAGVGVAGYADMPRDDAAQWLEANAEPGEEVEVYRRHLQDTAVAHSVPVVHAFGAFREEELDPCPAYIQLGYRDLLYMQDGTYFRSGPVRGSYVRNLIEGDLGYAVAAEFGPRPPDYLPQRATPGDYGDLLRYGVVPQTDQYADEQELRPNQYTLILERTEDCDPDRYPPF